MKKAFALLAGLVSAVAGQSAFAGGFGSSGYGSSGYSAGYGSSGYSTYAGYGSSGYSSGYGSSGYSSGYGSSGYSSGYGSSGYSSGYGSSGYSAGYGSSGYASARPHHRLFGHHLHRRAAYGSSGYSAGYGSSGYSSGYGSSGYSSGYGSSGYSTGYGSSGYSSGYGSSGYSSGYGSSGYSTSYGSSGGSSGGGSSGGTYYGASTNTSRYNGTTYGVAGSPPYPAPAGYHWEQRGTVTNAVAGTTPAVGTAGGPPYPAPAGYHWEQRGQAVAGTVDKTYGASPYGTTTNAPPYPAPAGYHWEQRGVAPAAAPLAPVKDDGASVDGSGQMRLVHSSTELKSDEIQLTVNVPESARIFVNGNATTSTGASRQFVSRGLDPKQDYRFEIRVENSINGKDVVDTKTVVLSPGQGEVLSFDLRDSNSPVETILTLNVPADATVVLAGNETKTTGLARTYRTKDLKAGQVWDDYTVVVTSNGVSKEKTIRLIAGDDLELTFSFDQSEDRVAMR